MDVQSDVFQPNHVALGRLHGESGVNEQHGVFFRHGMVPRGESGERALHRTCSGDAAEWVDIHADKRLHESRSSLLDAWYAPIGWINRGTALAECLLFCLQCNF